MLCDFHGAVNERGTSGAAGPSDAVQSSFRVAQGPCLDGMQGAARVRRVGVRSLKRALNRFSAPWARRDASRSPTRLPLRSPQNCGLQMTNNEEFPVLSLPPSSSIEPIPEPTLQACTGRPTGGVRRAHRWAAAAVCGAALALLSGCSGTGAKTFEVQENFGSVATYSRLFDATPGQTCEASRRALLSQGYIITSSSADLVEDKKSFQPEAESHLQMVVRVVCVPEANDGKVSLGFVTALQDTYALRKTNNSASLGWAPSGRCRCRFRRAASRSSRWAAPRSPRKASTKASSIWSSAT